MKGEYYMDNDWRDIPGYEGLYSVNSQGDIISHYSNKILKPSISNCGYKQCVLHKDKKQHIMSNHKAVALAFIPREDSSLVVNHKDENKLNCAVDNLEWVTKQDNCRYMGNRAAQGVFKKYARSFFAYDTNLNFLGEYLGTRKYAKDHGLSNGTLTTVITENHFRDNNYRTYKGIIYLDHKLEE